MSAETELLDKVRGGLLGAVIGDAMGTATETMTRRRITEVYDWLDEIVTPVYSPFSGKRRAGTMSDDSTQMCILLEHLLKTSEPSVGVAVDALLDWADRPDMPLDNAGPTTRIAIKRLRDGEDPAEVGRGIPSLNTGATNGSIMKIAPVGWLNPADRETAVEWAAVICTPTHNTQLAISGASAIAAGIATACAPGATVEEVIESCLWGAREGEARGLEMGREVAGASVLRRMEEAIRIVGRADSVRDVIGPIGDVVGSGLSVSEATAAAVGVLAAAQGAVEPSIEGAVNIGDDTDTVASVVGALAGTLQGASAIPERWAAPVREESHFDLDQLAADVVTRVAERRA